MASKKKVAAVGIPVAILLTIIGGMSLDFDFSQTNIGQIGDINNLIQQNFGVNLDEFKRMCDRGEIHDEFEKYCNLIP